MAHKLQPTTYNKRKFKYNSGQVMLLTTFALGASVVVFSAVVGYFLLQRIRMSSNVVDSARAIMAADAGLECELFNNYKSPSSTIDCNAGAFNDFTDASTYVITSINASSIKSIGVSNNSSRAFEAGF